MRCELRQGEGTFAVDLTNYLYPKSYQSVAEWLCFQPVGMCFIVVWQGLCCISRALWGLILADGV